MNYTSIENDIVARLAPLVTAGYQVEAMPDRESDNIGVGHKGRVTVQVTMAKYGEHRSTPPAVVQEEDVYVDIILRARTLRALGGIYDLCELCRGLLIGFAPDNCRLPLSGVDFGSIAPAEYDSSVHMYSLRLKTQTISVGGPDVDVTPLITEITFDDQTTSGPAPSVELYASAYNVLASGDQVILAWVTSGVGELFLSGVGIVEPIGTATVTITDDITYTLTLTNGLTVTSDTVDIEIGFGNAQYELYNTEGTLLENGSIPSNEVSGITAPDATVLINGNQFDTVASGDAIDLPVVNGGSNPVGSEQSGEWVIGNSTVTINGTQVGDIEAEDSLPIAVELDGNPAGTWNAGTQTWEVTSTPCADATFSIDGTQVDTIASGTDLDVTLLLDGVAPPSYTYNAGTDTLNVISPPPSTGWVRNPDWLPMPTVGAEEFVMLLAVFEDRTNKLTMTVSGVALVDYGDGTTVNSNGLAQLHTYDYTTLAGTVSVDPVSGQNYKQVIVKVTRIAANITAITFTGGPVFALDIEATLPNATNLNLVVSNLPLYLCERIVINSVAAGYNTLERLVNGSNRLRVFSFPWGTPTSLGSGAAFTSCPIDDLGNVTSSSSTFTSYFQSSQVKKIGTITNNTATNWSFLVDQAALLEQVTGIASTSMTTGLVAFRLCGKLRGTVTVNCPSLSNADSMFQNCAQLDGLVFTNAAAMVTTTNLVNGCRMLGNLVITGLTRGINLTTTNLGNFGMSNFANSIGTASGAQTITVTGTPFGVLLTALDATAVAIRNVMTGKGYTIAN